MSSSSAIFGGSRIEAARLSGELRIPVCSVLASLFFIAVGSGTKTTSLYPYCYSRFIEKIRKLFFNLCMTLIEIDLGMLMVMRVKQRNTILEEDENSKKGGVRVQARYRLGIYEEATTDTFSFCR